MRAELYKIGCTNCDLDEILLEGGSKYIYEGEPIKKPAMVNYGYCKKCNRIDKILEPFTIKHLNLSVKEFVSLNQENESQSFFSKMLSSVSPELKSATEKVKREEGRLSYFQNNEYRRRCINCSSHDVQLVNLPNRVERQKVLIDIKHKCNGELHISYGGHVNLNSASEIRYTVSGKVNNKTSIEFCKKLADSARIETVLSKGLISGFIIYLDQDLSLLKSHFRHKFAQISFIRNIENRIQNKDFLDDRKEIMRSYDIFDFKGETDDDFNSMRVVLNRDQIFYKWKPKNQQ